MKLCFATNNINKLNEINALVDETYQVIGLKEIGCEEELPETHNTLEDNSLEKANYIHTHYGLDCFADDTGLEVFALHGAPGVFSARYAGPQKNSYDNTKLLLKNLEGIEEREAQFRTVITLILGGEKKQFEGIAKGRITKQERGEKGFGYDPVFVPEGYAYTFAEMTTTQKNIISHRALATHKLINYLNEYNRIK